MTYNITQAIGNTPLVKLQHIVPAGSASVYVKLEYLNPTGSYKDRMALAIIEEAENRGDLRKGMTVIESTAGSTGTALAFVCAIKGYIFKAISSDAFAKEKLQSMRLFGADLELIPSEGGRVTPELIPKMISRVEEISKNPGTFWTRQFENRDAQIGYQKMGEEIVAQLDSPIDIFCAGVGTAGMLTGVSKALKKINPTTEVVALEPASAPFLSKGIKGSHKVEGIAPGFVPPMLDKSLYDRVMAIDETAARSMAKQLAAKEGIFAGISTGLNVCAAIELAQSLGSGHTVVTVACDSGIKYISGGLFD